MTEKHGWWLQPGVTREEGWHELRVAGAGLLFAVLLIGAFLLVFWGLYTLGHDLLRPWLAREWHRAVRDACRRGKCR